MPFSELQRDRAPVAEATPEGRAAVRVGPELEPDMQASHPGMRKGESAVDYFGRVLAERERAVVSCEMMGRMVMGG